MDKIQEITIETLIDRYQVLLLDAFGVLVHSSGTLAGAAELITELNRSAKPYYILTNDASRLPATAATRAATCRAWRWSAVCCAQNSSAWANSNVLCTHACSAGPRGLLKSTPKKRVARCRIRRSALTGPSVRPSAATCSRRNSGKWGGTPCERRRFPFRTPCRGRRCHHQPWRAPDPRPRAAL